MHTQVGIIGAGPAGLLLGQMMHVKGIDSVILESRNQAYVIDRVRAGVLEQFTADFMEALGVGERLHREGMRHDDVYVSFGGRRHLIPLAELTGGKAIYVYGQNEVVKDLMKARLATGRPLHYEISGVSVRDFDTDKPRIRYRYHRSDQELTCDFIAGCDGFHGICRPALASALGDAAKSYDRTYPCGRLGILAEAPPSSDALVYTYHERGFALYSMRSQKITRLYFQVPPDEDIRKWSDEAIWGRDARAYYDARRLEAQRNLAAPDVVLLGKAFAQFYRENKADLLARNSCEALKRVWKVQRFSWWDDADAPQIPRREPVRL
jgi:p-hydroxybenzoate 3-monooxygenase